MVKKMIKENLNAVQSKISDSCLKANRHLDDVTLIAVSKTKPLCMLEEAYASGIRHFGENKVQEIIEKYDHMPEDVQWHMIGHLQRNKVKYIIDKVSLIHSVDSLRLAEEINKQAQNKQLVMPILIELNIADEDSKFGVAPAETLDLIRQISKLENLSIKGLMTVAPFVENAEDNRQYFKVMKQLSVDIMKENIDNVSMDILSMGMTGDYEVAIEEGATMVRVGTGIFGERNYQ